MAQLCDITEIRAGYPFRGSVPNMPDGLCQVIQPKDVFGGGIIDKVALRFTPERLKPDYLLKNKDILLSSRGEFKAALYKGKSKTLASNLLFVLSIKEKAFLPEYLVFYLNSKSGQAQMAARKNPGTMQAIVRSGIESLDIPLLPIKRQKLLAETYFLLLREKELSQRLAEEKTKLLELALNTEIKK
ncbi:MAG: restriction endonuclease subunit S [Alphaproteobacteria bacterium]|nr:restriction endonuclease subunit S [Alphaproteobacteria bacterium]